MFCCTLLYVPSSIAIILMVKRELVALFSLSSWCLMNVVWLFLVVSWVCLQFVIVVFLDHTHYFFYSNIILLTMSAVTIDPHCIVFTFTVCLICSITHETICHATCSCLLHVISRLACVKSYTFYYNNMAVITELILLPQLIHRFKVIAITRAVNAHQVSPAVVADESTCGRRHVYEWGLSTDEWWLGCGCFSRIQAWFGCRCFASL